MEKVKILLHIQMIRQRIQKNLAVFLSLGIHLLSIVFLLMTPNKQHEPIPTNVTVRQVSEQELAKQIHDDLQHVSADDPEFRSIDPPNTKYKSKHNQKADKNTVAPNTDKFKNSKKLGGMSEDDAPPQDDTKFGDSKKSITQKGKYKPDTPKGKGVSAQDDFIEGAEIGPRTILNTQEYKYHSFYERIKEQLVDRWRPKIRKAIDKVKRIAEHDKSQELTIGAKTTRLEVQMNGNGEIVTITVIKSSGVPEFDKAAIDSFNEAAPFPHPPSDLVKNGVFIIRWDFTVNVEQASMVELKMQKAR